jgi:hypothetical protein
MQDKYNALLENNTWQLVPRPSNTNIVSSKWVFVKNLILMVVLLITKLVGSVVIILNNTVLIMMKLSLL